MTADYLVKKGEIKFAILLDICIWYLHDKLVLTRKCVCDSICITVRVLCDPDVIYQYGLVLVSTGQLKTVKLSVDCDHVKTQT